MSPETLAQFRSIGKLLHPKYDGLAEAFDKMRKLTEEKKNQKLELTSKEENQFGFKYDDKSITINKTIYTYEVILKKINIIKKSLSSIYENLSDEEKLIIDLPLIEWKLNYKHGAVMILLWLEGKTESVKLEYDFFMSETRVKDIDKLNLKEYLKNVKYLSAENLGYYPSNPDGVNLFLFDDSIKGVRNSLELFNKNLKKLKSNTFIGDYKNLSEKIVKDPIIKDNFFNSFSIGSSLGNIDNIGTALGRYSYRVYFKGILNKNTSSNKWILNIEEIAGRFVDEFSFNDGNTNLNPKTWKSQSLGCWNHSLKEPDVSRLKTPLFSDKICLENQDFISLRNKAIKKGVKIGVDFLIYSDRKVFSDDFVQKEILIY